MRTTYPPRRGTPCGCPFLEPMRIPYRPVWAPLVGALSWSPDESRITPQGHPLCVPLWIHPNLRSSKPQRPPSSRNSNTKTAQNCHQNANLSMLQCDSMNDPGMNSLQQPTDYKKRHDRAAESRRPHHPPGRPAEPVLTFGTVVCLQTLHPWIPQRLPSLESAPDEGRQTQNALRNKSRNTETI